MSAEIPGFAHCDVTRDDRDVYTARICEAKSLNILSTAVINSVTAALAWISTRDDARAVILRGSGDRAFVGGADIFEMATLDSVTARTFITNLGQLCEAVRRVPVPTIARLPGHCLGGGMEIAAACDIRLASADAVFAMPEVRVGIPSVIHAVLLPRLIGPGATNWMLLTGESIDAEQASKWGFVEFLCAPGELDNLIEKTVAPIVESGPAAIRIQKALLRAWETDTIDEGVARSIDAFAEAFETDEPQRYMAPFVNRKK